MTCQAEHSRKLLCSGISANFMTVLRKWLRLLDFKCTQHVDLTLFLKQLGLMQICICRPSIVVQASR